jgi:flagella basal body P-ring formation protein FlgA
MSRCESPKVRKCESPAPGHSRTLGLSHSRTRAVGLARTAAITLALVAFAGAADAQEQPAGKGTVPVAARDLPRGAVLERQDIALAPAEGGGEAVTDPEGWVTRRVIAKGEVLRKPAITRPDLVASGEVVQLVWRQGSVELRLIGRAMGSAARGERVHVRVDGKRRFTGVVEGPALVRIEAGDKDT